MNGEKIEDNSPGTTERNRGRKIMVCVSEKIQKSRVKTPERVYRTGVHRKTIRYKDGL